LLSAKEASAVGLRPIGSQLWRVAIERVEAYRKPVMASLHRAEAGLD
ncbi:2625_t:CDS:2, partial [Cetraspora pellucida]